ncbi:hypothetical protein [Nitrosomonas sp.]|nr:hypothetical protein [Nitrosomonas sp.]
MTAGVPAFLFEESEIRQTGRTASSAGKETERGTEYCGRVL